MIQQSVECKRIGNEYVDLFRKLLQYIHYTNFSKDFITDDDLKMLSELEFYISSGKYEIIEFGTRKSPFDVREKLEELEQLKEDLDAEKSTSSNLASRIDKAIEYIGNGNLGITRKTREKFIKILKGSEE